MADLAGAQFLRLGREAKKGIDLARSEQLDRLQLGVDNEMDVGFRVEPNLGSHQRHQRVRLRADPLYADGFALQIADAADVVTAKQFETADHDPAEQCHRLAGVDRYRA
jgi:hypothetical protein